MDKFKLKEIIDASDDEYNSLYEKINVIDKHQTDFNQTYYNEIIYLSLFLFHIKKGIDKLKGFIASIKGFFKIFDNKRIINYVLYKART